MITPATLNGRLYMRLPEGGATDLGAMHAGAVNKFTHPPFWLLLPEEDPFRDQNYLFQGEDGSIWDFKVGWEEWRKR